MYDTHTRYLVSAFLDASSLEIDNQELVSLMQQLSTKLDNLQLVPSIVQEDAPGGAIPRYALMGFTGLWQWQIILGSRFQIGRAAANPFAGADLGSFAEFCHQAVGILVFLVEHFQKTPYRLAAVQEGYLVEMSPSEMTAIARRLMTLGPTYADELFSEWDRRVVAEISRRFGGLEEPINTITAIRKAAGLSVQAAEAPITLPLNRIKVDIDTNTHQSNTSARFQSEHIGAFYEEAISWHRQLSVELKSLIFG